MSKRVSCNNCTNGLVLYPHNDVRDCHKCGGSGFIDDSPELLIERVIELDEKCAMLIEYIKKLKNNLLDSGILEDAEMYRINSKQGWTDEDIMEFANYWEDAGKPGGGITCTSGCLQEFKKMKNLK